MVRFLVVVGLSVLSALVVAGVLQPVAPPVNPKLEYRQCGEPRTRADGSNYRSSSVLAAYRRLHPCPVTGRSTGPCPGWAINHVIPLEKGGCDAVINLQWIPVQVKSCREDYCVDRWERRYYGDPHGVLDPIR